VEVQIINHRVKLYPNLGRYFYVELRLGKRHLSVVITPHNVQVCVHNASNRVWRGMGKSFPALEAALDNYSTPAVRSMIEFAGQLNQSYLDEIGGL
jgi:hypothetical protein